MFSPTSFFFCFLCFCPCRLRAGLSDDSMASLGGGGMALQLDASPPGTFAGAFVTSRIPPASRVGRQDVAKLAVLSLLEPQASRRILTCRWVNGSSSSRRSEQGSPTWAGEFAKVAALGAGVALSPNGSGGSAAVTLPKSRPYALAVAVVPLLTLAILAFAGAILAFAAAKVV
jgi:hypothetical protein